MRNAPGRWVTEDDFFGREKELAILSERVKDGNHVLLTGQRRMGKTSVAQELGRRLERDDDWTFIFADVEGALSPEDAIADIAKAAHSVRSFASRFFSGLHAMGNNIEEASAFEFRIKVRANLNDGSWRNHGERLLRECVAHDTPVLLVIDELPILLARMLRDDDGAKRVGEFLSWFRGVLQSIDKGSLVVMLSGSIGLEPLVQRLGITDRINHYATFRLQPWNRTTTVACMERLAASYGLRLEQGVPEAVYDALGIGVPYQAQMFFSRLREHATTQQREQVTVQDVRWVYDTAMLGPEGHNELLHYETRLREALDKESYIIALEILTETATEDVFTARARRSLEHLYAAKVNAPACIADTLAVLEHDGYLDAKTGDDYRFPSRLLRDWWCARFGNRHIPLAQRLPTSSEQLQ